MRVSERDSTRKSCPAARVAPAACHLLVDSALEHDSDQASASAAQPCLQGRREHRMDAWAGADACLALRRVPQGTRAFITALALVMTAREGHAALFGQP